MYSSQKAFGSRVHSEAGAWASFFNGRRVCTAADSQRRVNYGSWLLVIKWHHWRTARVLKPSCIHLFKRLRIPSLSIDVEGYSWDSQSFTFRTWRMAGELSSKSRGDCAWCLKNCRQVRARVCKALPCPASSEWCRCRWAWPTSCLRARYYANVP